MNKEMKVFKDFCLQRKLKKSGQRNQIIEKFLTLEKHVSALELYAEMKKQGLTVGYSTVYRTLKLLAESGLAREVNFGDGEIHFEHKFQHKHHDHLLCLNCGRTIEFSSPKIENLQSQIANKNKFKPKAHNLVIYGLCEKCR
jgi:Fur family transcriptional regulator, ferric uptake regulator